LINPSVYRVIF